MSSQAELDKLLQYIETFEIILALAAFVIFEMLESDGERLMCFIF